MARYTVTKIPVDVSISPLRVDEDFILKFREKQVSKMFFPIEGFNEGDEVVLSSSRYMRKDVFSIPLAKKLPAHPSVTCRNLVTDVKFHFPYESGIHYLSEPARVVDWERRAGKLLITAEYFADKEVSSPFAIEMKNHGEIPMFCRKFGTIPCGVMLEGARHFVCVTGCEIMQKREISGLDIVKSGMVEEEFHNVFAGVDLIGILDFVPYFLPRNISLAEEFGESDI